MAPLSTESRVLLHPKIFNLHQHGFFMIDADAVRGHLPVIESDLADQRLLSFHLAPCAYDFHVSE